MILSADLSRLSPQNCREETTSIASQNLCRLQLYNIGSTAPYTSWFSPFDQYLWIPWDSFGTGWSHQLVTLLVFLPQCWFYRRQGESTWAYMSNRWNDWMNGQGLDLRYLEISKFPENNFTTLIVWASASAKTNVFAIDVRPSPQGKAPGYILGFCLCLYATDPTHLAIIKDLFVCFFRHRRLASI